MPAISRIRITNLVYENGAKRFLDDIFTFEGQNGILLLENGGGKTVLVQAVLQVVTPNARLGERQARSTFALDNSPLHIAVEWILNERPRRLGLTAVTLFAGKDGLDSLKYIYEYQPDDPGALESLPFTRLGEDGRRRPAGREEMGDYYQRMSREHMNAHYFQRLGEYHRHLEEHLQVIPSEWMAIARINSLEGGVEDFFAQCKTTTQLVNNLLIPSIEEVMAGQGARDFALTFHQQRDHFKRYKLLQESIEENRRVESAIAKYTDVFGAYHQEEEGYRQQRGQARSLYHRACGDMEAASRRAAENRAALEEQERLEHEWQRKQGSWELARRREDCHQARQRWERADEDFNDAFQAWQSNERRLQALEMARIGQQIAVVSQRITRLEEAISRLGMERPVKELEQALAENGSALRCIFANEEAALRARESEQENRRRELVEERKERRRLKAGLEAEQEQARTALGRIQERGQAARKAMQTLERKLLANPARERVETEREHWLQRLKELARQQAGILELMHGHEDELVRVEAAIPTSRAALEESQAAAGQLRHQLERVNEVQNELLQQVRLCCQGFEGVETMYKKQQALQEEVLYRLKVAEARRESLMHEERQLRGLAEMHSGLEHFAADPYLAECLRVWQTRFSYLQSGAQFVQEMAERQGTSTDTYYRLYSYWAISVVCQPAERERLIRMLEEERSRLCHPVLVLDTEAARGLLAGGLDPLFDGWRPAIHSVFPLTWERNLEGACFADWQQEIREASDRATEERRLQEQEWQQCKQLVQAVQRFYADNPQEEYRRLQDEEQEQQLKVLEQREQVQQLDENRQELARLLRQDRQKASELEREQQHLQNIVEQSGQYLEQRRQAEQAARDEILCQEKAEKLAAALSEQDRALDVLERSLQDCSAGIARWSQLAGILRREALYIETIDCMPLESGDSREILAERRRNIKDELHKRQQGRQELEDSLAQARSDRQQYQNDMAMFVSRHRNEDIPEIELPAGYEEEMANRADQAPGLVKDRDARQRRLRQEEKKFAADEAVFLQARDDFHARFELEFEFTEALATVKADLEREREALEERARDLEEQRQAAITEQSDCQAAVAELEKKNERYEFLAEGVPAVNLDPDVERDFPYQRTAMVACFATRLESAREAAAHALSRLETERRAFERFAAEEICDIKLKERIKSGIAVKHTCSEVLEWQANMKERIKQAIRMAEDDLQEHERELKQFVGRLHTYLAGLADELRQIPRMTRVKAGDSWREIFHFDVPGWGEDEGREALTRHVNWMISQLEDPRFRDQDGGENRAAILAELEKWLQSTSLLRNVMKGAVIKVKCRKVTADRRIGGSLMSWESSNQWSGGEKWSKNMALFLGLLNYMAEKRQPVSGRSGRQRTVLLDNPFGKASSEHVLAPVFFIAERLGFQIIALTALAEGKFVRDYFPVVYSCRLRQAAGRDQQVVTVEQEGAREGSHQEMRHLQFHDLEPEALSLNRQD